MDPHLVELPREILIGRNVYEKIPNVLTDLKVRGPLLLLTGTTTGNIAGNRVADILAGAVIVQKTGDGTAEEVETICKRFPVVNGVISVGGGRVIDAGKLAAWRLGVPFLSVPTAPSHDGIASERVSILKNGKKASERGKPPIAIIADVDVISHAPHRLIAAGCADVLANITAVRDWELAREHTGEYFSEYAAQLSLLSARVVMSSAGQIAAHEERGIRNLIEALVSSGIAMSLAGTSRPGSGSEHSFSHALDSLGSPALHGEQCGLGAVLMACLQGQDWNSLRLALKTVQAPTTVTELGVTREKLVQALLLAKGMRSRFGILDLKPLDRAAADTLLAETGAAD